MPVSEDASSLRDCRQTHVVIEWKHDRPLVTCRFNPSGNALFTSAEDNNVQRWEFPSGKKVDYAGHDSWVRDIAFLPDNETVVTVASDDKMIFWSATAEKPAPMKTIEAHKGWIRTIAVSPDGKLIATGGNDNLVKLWNAADATHVRDLAGHDSDIYSVLFHPDGKSLLSGDLSGIVRQWDIANGTETCTFDAKELHTYNGGQQVHYGGVRNMALSPDGKHLACCGLHKATNPLGAVNEPLVLVFDWEDQKKVQSHIGDGALKGIAWRVHYLSDGTLVGASGGSGGGFLLFWKADQDKEFHKLKLPDTARGLDLHPDDLHLATVHYDKTVRISKMAAKAAS